MLINKAQSASIRRYWLRGVIEYEQSTEEDMLKDVVLTAEHCALLLSLNRNEGPRPFASR